MDEKTGAKKSNLLKKKQPKSIKNIQRSIFY